jgi:ADP-ribose pyrophosphatase YjhB (NUDIX family)
MEDGPGGRSSRRYKELKMKDPLGLLEQLREIASEGLLHASNPYDHDRYERLLEIASSNYAVISGVSEHRVRQIFRKELGVVTPKLGVDAAILDDSDRVLLVRRADDGRFCLPGGWVRPDESLEAAVAREVTEETGLKVIRREIIAAFSRRAILPNTPYGSCHILFVCVVKRSPVRLSHESTDFVYWDPWKRLRWHRDHRRRAQTAVEYVRAISKAGLTKADSRPVLSRSKSVRRRTPARRSRTVR